MAWTPEPRRRGRVTFIPLAIAAVVALVTYLSSERFVNPETGRVARLAMTESQEAALGLQSYREVLANSQAVTAGPDYERVVRVAQKLAGVTGDAGARFDWQVSLIQDPQANAFCLPGGKIVVYTGILPIAGTDAGLATVMGHEMAHATSRHGSQRVLQGNLANLVVGGAQASMALSDMDRSKKMAVLAAVGAGAKFGVLLPFSREHETEADEVGLRYLVRAGYDPNEAVRFWERMGEKATGRQPPEFMSTHPSHDSRIERLRALIPKVQAEARPLPGA